MVDFLAAISWYWDMIAFFSKPLSTLCLVSSLVMLGGCATADLSDEASQDLVPAPEEEAVAQEEVEEEWDYDQIFLDGSKAAWPGYPALVSGNSIDGKVLRSMGNPEQVVAIGPAMYLPYLPSQPDLDFYLLNPTGVSGNCVMIYTLEDMMNLIGKRLPAYSCWNDVYIGDEEPVIE